MNAQAYSVSGQTEGRRKAFLEGEKQSYPIKLYLGGEGKGTFKKYVLSRFPSFDLPLPPCWPLFVFMPSSSPPPPPL